MRTRKKRYFISYTYVKGNNIGFGSCINDKGYQKIKDMEKEIIEQYEYDSAVILNVLPEYIEESEDTECQK